MKAVVLQTISAVCVVLWEGKEFPRTGVDVVLSTSTRCGSLVGGSLCGVVVAHLSCNAGVAGSNPVGMQYFSSYFGLVRCSIVGKRVPENWRGCSVECKQQMWVPGLVEAFVCLLYTSPSPRDS